MKLLPSWPTVAGIVAGAAVTFIVMVLFPGHSNAATTAEAVEAAGGEQPIIVTGGSGYAPFYFADAQGNPDGIMADIWRSWSDAASRPVVFRMVPWENTIDAVLSGHADVIIGLNVTPERAEVLDFGPPYLVIDTRVYFADSIPMASQVSDFEGFEVGVVRGDYAERYLRGRHPELQLVSYPSYETMVDRAAAGDIRVMVGDDMTIEFYMAKEGNLAQSMKVLPEPLHRQSIAAAVAKGRQDLVSVISTGFETLGPEEVQHILARWRGENVVKLHWNIVLLAVAAPLAFALIIFAWNRLLSRRVDAATRELQQRSDKLEKSEEEIRTILSSMSCLILEIDIDGVVLRIVRSGYKPHEFDPKLLEGKNVSKAFKELSVELPENFLAEVILSGQTKTIPVKIVPDKETIFFAATCSPLTPTTALVVCHDETELRKNETKYRELVELAGCIIMRLDALGNIQFFNKYAQSVFGLGKEDVLGKSVRGTILSADDTSEMFDLCGHDENSADHYTYFEGEHFRSDHTKVNVQWAVKPIMSADRCEGLQCIGHDITAQRNAQVEIERRENYYKALIEQSSDLITVIDESGYILFESPAITHCLGQHPDEAMGSMLNETLHPEDMPTVQTLLSYIISTQEKASPRFEFRRRHKNGSWLDFEGVVTNQLDEEAVGGLIINAHDVTERKSSVEELRRHTFYDNLIGLPNRALLLDRLQLSLERSKRKSDYAFAVLFVDLDRFKVVNDSLGHAIGDKLLQEIGTRLTACLRKTDTLARFGSDEFVLLLDEIENDRTPIRVAERVREELARPMKISDDAEIFTSASIGIVYSSPQYADPEQMIRDADIAMHQAKGRGDCHYTVFHSGMHQQAQAQLKLETDLRKALEQEEFELHYQPIVELTTRKIVGLEALIRWNHPQRGFVPPLEFIPLAEETGIIVPLGEWVLRTACQQVNPSEFAALGHDPVEVSVNLSPKQLMRTDLSERILTILDTTGFEPQYLKLEVTESTIMESLAQASATFETLKRVGIKLAIDDFGTGYSSLSCLHSLPFDTLKIDRKFTAGLDEDRPSKKTNIVNTILALAKGLNLNVVAEGIETPAQIERLAEQGCPLGQGYYFARPMPVAALREFISQPRPNVVENVVSTSPGAYI